MDIEQNFIQKTDSQNCDVEISSSQPVINNECHDYNINQLGAGIEAASGIQSNEELQKKESELSSTLSEDVMSEIVGSKQHTIV